MNTVRMMIAICVASVWVSVLLMGCNSSSDSAENDDPVVEEACETTSMTECVVDEESNSEENSDNDNNVLSRHYTIPVTFLLSEIGVPENRIPSGEEMVSVRAFGAIPNDDIDDTGAILEAINSAGDDVAVQFERGDYLLSKLLKIERKVFLRGVPGGGTRFFITSSTDPVTVVTYSKKSDWVDLEVNVAMGSNQLVLDRDSAALNDLIGYEYIEVEQDAGYIGDSPPSTFAIERSSFWQQFDEGTMARITSVDENTITLEAALSFNFNATTTRVRGFDLIEYAVFKNITFFRSVDTVDPRGDTLHIINTRHVVVENSSFHNVAGSHLTLRGVYQCTVNHNGFYNAFNYEPGRAYGVELTRHTTGCLVEDNVVSGYRHAFLTHLGANNSAFLNNYSEKNSDEDGGVIAGLSGHGYNSARILFEGNITDQAQLDAVGQRQKDIDVEDANGMRAGNVKANGQDFVFFRNCIESTDGITVLGGVDVRTFILNNALVSDEVASLGAAGGTPSLLTQTVTHGNLRAATDDIQYADSESETSFPASYIYSRAPTYYDGTAWPSTGGDLGINCSNPARERHIDAGNAL